MRVGVIPENLVERIVGWLGLAPEPLLETQMAFSMARSIMAGSALGLYDAVADGPLAAAEIAQRCGTNPRATEKLLNALVSCGYFRFRAGRYALTRKARRWMLRDAEQSVHEKMIFQQLEWGYVAGTEEFVRTGRTLDLHSTLGDETTWEHYQRGMRALAALTAGDVAARLPVPPGARDLLDIGGSHGFYSVCLCRKHPALRAVILDLPDAAAKAAPLLAREGMGDRVTHRPGNALTDDLGEGSVDVVFMSQLIHHFSDEQNQALVKRIARALRPGGVCAIFDSILPDTPGRFGQSAALLDVYFAMTSESGTWPLEAIHGWYRAAGLVPRAPLWLRSLPGSALVIASRPA